MCNNQKCHGHFEKGESQENGNLSPLLEERFIDFHVIGNSIERSFGHAKVLPEHVRREGTSSHKLATHELLVAFSFVPVKLPTDPNSSYQLPLSIHNHHYYLVFFGVYGFTLELETQIR